MLRPRPPPESHDPDPCAASVPSHLFAGLATSVSPLPQCEILAAVGLVLKHYTRAAARHSGSPAAERIEASRAVCSRHRPGPGCAVAAAATRKAPPPKRGLGPEGLSTWCPRAAAAACGCWAAPSPAAAPSAPSPWCSWGEGEWGGVQVCGSVRIAQPRLPGLHTSRSTAQPYQASTPPAAARPAPARHPWPARAHLRCQTPSTRNTRGSTTPLLATHDRLMRDVKRTCGGCAHAGAQAAGRAGDSGHQTATPQSQQTIHAGAGSSNGSRGSGTRPWRSWPTLSGYDSSQ